jgi:hypothetical protein
MRHATTRHFPQALALSISLLVVAALPGCGGASAFSDESGSSSSGSSSSSSSASSSSSSSSSSSGSSSSSSSSSGADARADFLYVVSGLNSGASVTLLLNGAYPQVVTQNTPSGVEEFFMSGSPAAILALPITGSYAITVGTQPTGQTCTVANGSGTVAFDNPVANVTCTASSGSGAAIARLDLASVSGGDGMSAVRPQARQGAASWSDSAGDLWLFGGQAADSNGAARLLGDFWKYDSNAREWLQIPQLARAGASLSGSGTTAYPSARSYAASWIDAAGTLWIFGGQGATADGTPALLNDLWAFSSSIGAWAQALGSSGPVPGARMAASFWVDPSGVLWLFGGYGVDATGVASQLDDLWRYSPLSKRWQQVGSSVSAAPFN